MVGVCGAHGEIDQVFRVSIPKIQELVPVAVLIGGRVEGKDAAGGGVHAKDTVHVFRADIGGGHQVPVLVQVDDGIDIGLPGGVPHEPVVGLVLMPFVGGVACGDDIHVPAHGVVDGVQGDDLIQQGLREAAQALHGLGGELVQVQPGELCADDVEKACDQDAEYDEIGQKIAQ